MPKITEKRTQQAEELEGVLKVLNGKYTHISMIEDIRDAEGRSPSWSPSEGNPEWDILYTDAVNRLQSELTELVEYWRAAKPSEHVTDLYGYLSDNPILLKAFERTAKRLGIDIKRRDNFLSFLSPWENPGGRDLAKLELRLFQIMAEEQGFLNSDDPLRGAEAEAMRLFLFLITSELAPRIGKCPRCGNYFFNLGGRREFCSHKCAQGKINKKRAERKNEVLKRLNEMLARCTNPNWKDWLAKEGHVSLTFLTRNERSIRIPKSLKESAL